MSKENRTFKITDIWYDTYDEEAEDMQGIEPFYDKHGYKQSYEQPTPSEMTITLDKNGGWKDRDLDMEIADTVSDESGFMVYHYNWEEIFSSESFGAEMDGKKLIASSYDLADGSMMVGVGTETLDVDDPDFMEMMIDEDGKIDYFTLPTGKGDYQRLYKIKPSHYGIMKTQNETNESAGGDFIRIDGDGKYAESFGAESDRDDTEYLEAMQGIITNFEDSFCPSCSWGLDKHTIVNFNGMPFAYCEMGDNPYMNAESFGAELLTPKFKGHDKCLECGNIELPLSEMDGGEIGLTDYYFSCAECDFSWYVSVKTDEHEDGDGAYVSDEIGFLDEDGNTHQEPQEFNIMGHPNPAYQKSQSESFGAELLDYPHSMSDRQKHRIRKLGGRIDKAMTRSDASRYIKSLMAVPLHAETHALDCSACQGWGWNEDLNMVCDADGCIGGWVVPKKPSLLERGLELGAGVGMGMAGVAILFGFLGGTVGFAAEELKNRRD